MIFHCIQKQKPHQFVRNSELVHQPWHKWYPRAYSWSFWK